MCSTLETVKKYQQESINRLLKFLYENDKETLKEFLIVAKPYDEEEESK